VTNSENCIARFSVSERRLRNSSPVPCAPVGDNRRGDVGGSGDALGDLARQVADRCRRIVLLYQPVAIDFREVMAVLRLAVELEHIGHLAIEITDRLWQKVQPRVLCGRFWCRSRKNRHPARRTRRTLLAFVLLRRAD